MALNAFIFDQGFCFVHIMHRSSSLQMKCHVDLLISPPLFIFSLLTTLHDGAVDQYASVCEILWPGVLPFDAQDMANRSHDIFWLPWNADLSCLQSIFKLQTLETYGAMGNFISDTPHLSDLIQVCRGWCRSMLCIYSSPEQTRAVAMNPIVNTLAGVMCGETFL